MYLHEFKRKTDKNSKRILLFVLAVMAAVAGIMFYATYSSFPEQNLSLSETTCESTIVSTYQLSTQSPRFEDISKAIESRQGYPDGSLVYRTISATEHCNNDLGLLFEHREGSKKFVYCINPSDWRVLEFDLTNCSSLNDYDLIEDSASNFLDVLSNN